MDKTSGMSAAALRIPTQPSPAFPIRSSRESDEVGRRGCIEHDYTKGSEIWTSSGTEKIVLKVRG
jgi:hypothetical protein